RRPRPSLEPRAAKRMEVQEPPVLSEETKLLLVLSGEAKLLLVTSEKTTVKS
ncbi:hypothetical protein PR002_g29141, partial [Phytophthora rubi]